MAVKTPRAYVKIIRKGQACVSPSKEEAIWFFSVNGGRGRLPDVADKDFLRARRLPICIASRSRLTLEFSNNKSYCTTAGIPDHKTSPASQAQFAHMPVLSIGHVSEFDLLWAR
jgi:hypothetical protein